MAQSLKTLIGKGATGGTATIDNREFKNWQDFYGCIEYGSETHMPSSTRDAGNTSGGTGTGPQERKVGHGVTKNWVVPNGVTKIRITAIGGGGGGASRKGQHYQGAGGGQGAPFVSGEFNVTGGETLNIQVGRGGEGKDSNADGNNGTQTEVVAASGSGGTAFINVASQGGYGGERAGNSPPSPSTGTLSGSALRSNNQINSKGGQGGPGDNNSIGWGPEGYGGGGGGSAGSYKGDGHEGGSGMNSYGYTYCGAGGGGIGGKGGNAGSSQTTSHYASQSGGGGGSRSAGGAGQSNSNGDENRGGAGWSDQLNVIGYTDDLGQADAQRSDDYRRGWPAVDSNDWSGNGNTLWWEKMKGIRYGDGYSAAPVGLRITGGGGGSAASYEAIFSGGGSGGSMVVTLNAKTFNGILGRCTGSGGAGSNSNNPNFGHNSARGGEGGSGGGGGGAAMTTTNDQTGNTDHWYEWNDFDVANMAFTAYGKGSGLGSSSYDGRDLLGDNWGKLQPMGGNGGALGGGGAGGNRSFGGLGGIGGGGGGACNHFSSGYSSRGGHGGPGYVLIEW